MTAKDWIDLAQALVSLITGIAWPAVFVFFILLFRTEIRRLIPRVKSWKGLGQEVNLQEDLAQLNVSAEAAQEEVAALPAPPDSEQASEAATEADKRVRNVLEVAATSPKAALLLLSADIEREVRELLASMGLVPERGPTLLTGIQMLDERGALPRHVASSLQLFRTVRNGLVHGGHVSDDDVFAAIDSGIAILRALYAVPHETHVVTDADVPVYADSEAQQRRDNVHGVILESTSPGGSRKYRRIFPTTRSYEPGERVSWEWNSDSTWGDSWYRDPESGEVLLAWNTSGEFVGRNLDTL